MRNFHVVHTFEAWRDAQVIWSGLILYIYTSTRADIAIEDPHWTDNIQEINNNLQENNSTIHLGVVGVCKTV